MKLPVEKRLLAWFSRKSYRGFVFDAGFTVYVWLSLTIVAVMVIARITGILDWSKDWIFLFMYVAGGVFFALFLLPIYIALLVGPYFWTFETLRKKEHSLIASRVVAGMVQVGYIALLILASAAFLVLKA